jgi:hypothetical protein
METFKIIKHHTPISIYSLFNRSERKESLLHTPYPSHNYTYQSSFLWNKFAKFTGIEDFTLRECSIKTLLKRSLLAAQNRYDDVEWFDLNFTDFA